jgi:hypothetical protein
MKLSALGENAEGEIAYKEKMANDINLSKFYTQPKIFIKNMLARENVPLKNISCFCTVIGAVLTTVYEYIW